LQRTGIVLVNLVWGQVWKLKVSAKIKIFSWRFLHGTIACNCVLANRHIIESSVCPVCKIFCEDTKHLFFFECGRVKEIWQNLGILSITEEACHSDREGSGVLETILRSDDVGVPGVRNGTQRINHYSLLVHVVGEEENFTR
jgi:hypothetical protein